MYNLQPVRRGGRVVDCTGLENQRTARFPGFKSLPLRHNIEKGSALRGLFCICCISSSVVCVGFLSCRCLLFFTRFLSLFLALRLKTGVLLGLNHCTGNLPNHTSRPLLFCVPSSRCLFSLHRCYTLTRALC